MKKTFLMTICGLMFALAGQAQTVDRLPFGKDKIYVAASVSGLDVNYNKTQDWRVGLNVKGGYLFEDDWMITANMGYDWQKIANKTFTAGAGMRYYIEQNGIYLGAGLNYVHTSGFDDLMPTVQVGYAYFLNRVITIEPELYYNQSLKDHSDYSGIGFRIGIGIYFE